MDQQPKASEAGSTRRASARTSLGWLKTIDSLPKAEQVPHEGTTRPELKGRSLVRRQPAQLAAHQVDEVGQSKCDAEQQPEERPHRQDAAAFQVGRVVEPFAEPDLSASQWKGDRHYEAERSERHALQRTR